MLITVPTQATSSPTRALAIGVTRRGVDVPVRDVEEQVLHRRHAQARERLGALLADAFEELDRGVEAELGHGEK